MPDLITFLNARLDEDERAYLPPHVNVDFAGATTPLAARALREVAAKRAILAEHEHVHPSEQELELRGRYGLTADRIGCSLCHSDDERAVQWWDGYCNTVQSLASVYADHADYDPEWSQQ